MGEKELVSRRIGGMNANICSAVTDYIAEHKLSVGDALPSELSFAEAAGVSRTIIRETFGALAALRLIDIGSGRRARVGAVDGSMLALMMSHAVTTEQSSVPQIWDVRRALEQRAVALAAMQRSATEAHTITGHAAAMRRAGDDLSLQVEHDIAFHQAIARASRNPVFNLLIVSFGNVMRETCPIGWRSRRTQADKEKVFDLHDRIADAIADRAPDVAEQAMAQHFTNSLTALSNSGYN